MQKMINNIDSIMYKGIIALLIVLLGSMRYSSLVFDYVLAGGNCTISHGCEQYVQIACTPFRLGSKNIYCGAGPILQSIINKHTLKKASQEQYAEYITCMEKKHPKGVGITVTKPNYSLKQ